MKAKSVIRTFVLLCFAVSVMACVQKSGYVWHDGQINHESVSIAIKRMESVKSLGAFYISSGGGNSAEGMRLGKYLQEREIPVVVVGRCFSACANYVLLPAKHRFAAPWAKIGMHGGDRSYQSRLIESAANIPPQFKRMYQESVENGEIDSAFETTLLRAAGVNPEIIEKSARETYYGVIDFKINRPDKVDRFVVEKKVNAGFELWFPRREDYAKWGIDITIIDPSSLPSEIFNLFSNFSDDSPISDVP